jgi:hypothetical protein
MAIKSNTVRGIITATTAADILSNTDPLNSYYIGQIDIVNRSSKSNTVEVVILSGGVAYLLLKSAVERDGSRVTDERKIPYELKPGEKLQAKLKTADATGMIIHVSYI